MKVPGTFGVEGSFERVSPILIMAPDLLDQVKYLVERVDQSEVQWYHTVKRYTSTKHPGKLFYQLEDLVIPHQTVHGTECETTTEDQYKTMQEVRARFVVSNFQTDPEAYAEEIAEYNAFNLKLRCWCHSHVNMTTSPSGTDDTQFKKMIEDQSTANHDSNQPIIMMIWNKRDELFTRIFDPEFGITWKNVPFWEYRRNVDTQYIDDAVKSKVTVEPWKHAQHVPAVVLGIKPKTIPWNNAVYSVTNTGTTISYAALYGASKLKLDRSEIIALATKINSSNKCDDEVAKLVAIATEVLSPIKKGIWVLNRVLDPTGKNWPAAVEELLNVEAADPDSTSDLVLLTEALRQGWFVHTHYFVQALVVAQKVLDSTSLVETKRLLDAHESWNTWINNYEYSEIGASLPPS